VNQEPVVIPPAEFVGMTEAPNGVLTIGSMTVVLGRNTSSAPIYVRRKSSDLSVIEVLLAFHDGYAQEELEAQNDEAGRYPLGPKEYWRGEMVGKYRYGTDQHLMTNEEFEADWAEAEDE
jgi:hypothetical protein